MAIPTRDMTVSADGHVVKIYDDDQDLVDSVAEFVAAGIEAGDAVIVVATPARRWAIELAGRAAGVDLATAAADGQYMPLDAGATLSRFVVDGVPHPVRFAEVVEGLLFRAGTRRVRVFGEMVAVLWDEGNVTGAINLESLWNDLVMRHHFSLYCAYAMTSLAGATDLSALRTVCDQHDSVVAPRSHTTDSSEPSDLHDRGPVSELFVPVPLAVRAVRRFVRRTLLAWSEDGLVDDAVLVASELAANAVVHARSPFRVSLAREAARVTLAVHDGAGGTVTPRGLGVDLPDGRGLALVAALCESWGTGRVADGKVVWAELAS